jgi:predicted ATPase
VGREKELARVSKALEVSRLVTLTGVGGVGKTRLALQTAAEVLTRFPDGAWFCELDAVRDPDLVAQTVAGALGVTARPGTSSLESLVGFLPDQTVLLVLDNCEHLLRAVAQLVVAVEAACPGVRVLATSREGLNVAGEQLIQVPSLGLPDGDPGGDPAECESVRLFVERARLVKADFDFNAGNQAEVAAVCRRLDGVALAIELAAARIPALTPAELLARLDRRFRLLSGGGRVAIERQRTLRATIDWSYDLLDASERRLLDRLAVFAGGFTLASVEAVCAGAPIDSEDALDLLAGLVARSLVEATVSGATTRYRLLEIIRQYGEERLAETGETEILRARHVDHFVDFAASVTPNMFGPGQREWGDRLAAERDNFQAAMAFALARDDVERAMALLCQTPIYFNQADSLVVFDPDAILALTGAREHPGSSRALYETGNRRLISGDYAGALEMAGQAEAALRRLGPAPGYERVDTLCLRLRALVANGTGPPERPAELFLQAAEADRAAGRSAYSAYWLGMAAYSVGWADPEAAARLGAEGLALARQTGYPKAIHQNLLGLALALASSDPERARQFVQEVLEVGYGSTMVAVTYVAGRLEDWPAVLRAADRTLQWDRRIGTAPRVVLAGIAAFVARALAASQPEAAAVLDGAATGLSHVFGPPEEAIAKARYQTTRLLTLSLGEARLRELRSSGEIMDYTQTGIYALDAIKRAEQNIQPAIPPAPNSRPIRLL